MMRFFVCLLSLFSFAMPALAQDSSVDCDALYGEIAAEHPIELNQCMPEQNPGYELDDCKKPTSFEPGAPTSHIILAIDASGSMAGPSGGESKMKAAKREALAFLNDVHDEISVSLVVYGHKGNNQDDGKAESCASAEMLHGFDAPRGSMAEAIADLSPTGWTPIAGVLSFAESQVKDLPEQTGDFATSPVVYLISDGEETCGGDPVQAALSLAEASVKTTINTIGFDTDETTAAQLEAIAEAGGGTYYPAKDANALQKQLNAIKEAEASVARYAYCVDLNAGKIGVAFHNQTIKATGCFQRNNPQNRQSAVFRALRTAEAEDRPELACKDDWSARVAAEVQAGSKWLGENVTPLNARARELVRDYYQDAGLAEAD